MTTFVNFVFSWITIISSMLPSTLMYIFDVDDLLFEPTLIDILQPLLPTGDWNHAHIFRGTQPETTSHENGEIQVKTSTRALTGISETWHPLQVDYLELEIGDRLRSNVYEAKCPQIPGEFVIKFAIFEYEIPILEQEITAYKWIQGHGIGPTFLGYVTEYGRVIGFAMSKIQEARHATPDDLDICQQALRSLHALGIQHGDTNKHNILIHSQGVALIDFECAKQNATQEELDKEMLGLEQQLANTSGKGGSFIIETISST